jgi:hypothetical protein
MTEAKRLGDDYVGTEHILIALTTADDPVVVNTFAKFGVNRAMVKAKLLEIRNRVR